VQREDGVTLQMERNRLAAALDPAKKKLPLAERLTSPPVRARPRSDGGLVLPF
jgi:hypothetical protein